MSLGKHHGYDLRGHPGHQEWLREAVAEPGSAVAEVSFLMGAYGLVGLTTASSAARARSATACRRRDAPRSNRSRWRTGATGRTFVTLSAISTGLALTRRAGQAKPTKFYISTPVVSSNNL